MVRERDRAELQELPPARVLLEGEEEEEELLFRIVNSPGVSLQVQVSQAKQPRVDDCRGREGRGRVSVEVPHLVGLGLAGPPSHTAPAVLFDWWATTAPKM